MNYTDNQIAEMKAKHGDIFLVEVEGKSCVLHKPKRKDLSYASAVKDPIKMQEVLLKQLWVDGDKEILEQDDFFLAVANKMDEIIKVKEAKVKKL